MDREQYGLFKQAFLVIMTAVTALPLGMGMSAFYFLAREKTRRRETVLNIVLFHAAMGALAAIALALHPAILTGIFGDAHLARYSGWIGVTILVWIVGASLDIIPVANDEIRLASALIVGIQASRAMLFVGAAAWFGTLGSLLAAAVFHGLIQSAVLLAYLHRRFAGFWRAFDWRVLRDQLSYAIPLGAAALLTMVQTDLHNYFVSHHFGASMFAVYSIGTLQLPLLGLLQEAANSVLITRVSIFEKQNQRQEIVAVLARAASKLAAVYFPVYIFLMVAGRDFIRALFTERFAESWPVFALNLTLVPVSVVLLDPLYRAFERERYFLLRVRICLAAALLLALGLFTPRLGLMGVIATVVLTTLAERVVMAVHFARMLGVRARDARLVGDAGKAAIAALTAGAATGLARITLAHGKPWIALAGCGAVFGAVYLPIALRWRIFTSSAVSSR